MSTRAGKNGCWGMTRGGIPCDGHPMRGSRFCYVHSLGHLRGVPLAKNASVHAVLGTILGVVGIAVSLWFGLIPSRQQKHQNDVVLETNQNVKAVREMLESVERLQSGRLLEKYSEGYVLFAIDASRRKTEFVIPRNSRISEEYEFDWAKVGISEVTPRIVTVRMPDILYKPSHGRFVGTRIGIRRRPLGKERQFPVELKGSTHTVFVELVEDSASQFAFAVGFRKE